MLSSPFIGQIPLPTPAPSFSSSFFDSPSPYDPSRLTHPMQRNKSVESRTAKRLQLAPKPRLSRHTSQPSSELSSFASLASPTTTACHICKRRPSTRQDIPSYLDCEVCELRTCYVCVRTCEGPLCQSTVKHQPHPGMDSMEEEQPTGKRICARCCIEVGSEGRVWCVSCYHDDTDSELFMFKRPKEELEAESACRIADWLNRTGTEEQSCSEPSSVEDYFSMSN